MKAIQDQEKMYFYESFAKDFDSKMNMYDTQKRVDVIFNELLAENISYKTLLDAGCGTGWFSKKAVERGAIVTSMDLGPNLLERVQNKCESNRVVGSILQMPFPHASFDIVVSSEVIEHTPDPFSGVREMYRVLKPGGTLVLTTPNQLWYPSVVIANKLHWRPYQGLENWTSWRKMKRELRTIGFQIEEIKGIHIFPFIHPSLYKALDFFHRFSKPLGPLMINIAVRCRK